MPGAMGFGLLSACFSGIGDVCGGLAARRARPLSVVLLVVLAGAILLLAAALSLRQPVPKPADLSWSAAAGVATAIGLLGLYTALGSGHMAIVAPLSSVVAILVPIVAGAILEGLPSPAQVAGFGFALLAVWLLSSTGSAARSLHQVRLALVAGLGFGIYFVLIAHTAPTSGLWNLSFARAFASIVLLALMRITRHPLLPPRSILPLNILNGSLDAGGNVFFVLAAQSGRLDVASVLSSLYPAATIAIAWLVLGERLGRPQAAGAGAAFVAIILIML